MLANNNVRFLLAAGMWIFLGPLIVTLGTLDVLTNGGTRRWPFDERYRAL